jgi:hypothetical protein
MGIPKATQGKIVISIFFLYIEDRKHCSSTSLMIIFYYYILLY